MFGLPSNPQTAREGVSSQNARFTHARSIRFDITLVRKTLQLASANGGANKTLTLQRLSVRLV